MTMVGFMVTLVKAGLVFGLLALTVKMLRRYDRRSLGSSGRRRRSAGGGGHTVRAGGRVRGRRRDDVIDVVERAALGRNAAMVLVRVQEQHFVLGVTDAKVSMLLEVDVPAEPDDDDEIDLRGVGATGGRAVLLGTELLRQARRRLPGGTRVELIDPAALTTEDAR